MWTRPLVEKMMGALAVGMGSFLRSLWRAARALFHEMSGAAFILFAIMGAISAWREWRGHSAEWLIALAIGFTVMMAVFAVSSFRRARRVR